MTAWVALELLIIAAAASGLIGYGYHRIHADEPTPAPPRVPEQRRPTGDDLLLAAVEEARLDFPGDIADDLADLHATVYPADIDWSARS